MCIFQVAELQRLDRLIELRRGELGCEREEEEGSVVRRVSTVSRSLYGDSVRLGVEEGVSPASSVVSFYTLFKLFI